MKIVFFCPPVSVINGGIKTIFRMAETLIADGRDAVVFEQNGQRPSWFASTAPVVDQSVFNNMEGHVYVLPEDQPHILRDFAAFPNRKVVFCQNHFYAALGLGSVDRLSACGITDVLCSSQTIATHTQRRHPDIRSWVVPCAVDRALFHAAPTKKKAIAFMPRKRPIEAAYIRDLFHHTAPDAHDWQWTEINDKSESETARLIGESAVFLSLSRLEGLGLTPLEAMAAGCTVAGFTGIGGQEYATPENGFWAAEDAPDACTAALIQACAFSQQSADSRQNYAAAAEKTLAAYSETGFAQATKAAWDAILSAC